MFYVGIGPEKGISIEDTLAFEYALDRCLGGNEEEKAEFKEMLVEWYYSGNWIEKEDIE